MRTLRYSGAWILVLAVITLGVLTTGLMSVAEDQDQLPAYLKDAKYITSAKCKLCHKPKYNEWAATQHAKHTEHTEHTEGGQAPAETAYRHVTGFNPDDGTYAEKGTACEACHGQYSIGDKRYAAGFLPGMDLFKMEGFKLDPVVPGKPLEQLNELSGSKHFANDVVCFTCHYAHSDTPQEHQLRKPIIELCTDCHKDKQMATHAPQAAAGSTCATCHMPNGQHLFTQPAPAP